MVKKAKLNGLSEWLRQKEVSILAERTVTAGGEQRVKEQQFQGGRDFNIFIECSILSRGQWRARFLNYALYLHLVYRKLLIIQG